MERIKALATEATVYSPLEAGYFDEGLLAREMERVMDVCQLCRLCFNLCPAFPYLFKAVDAAHGEVRALTQPQLDRVVDLCYQCGLCYPKCPYTPAEKHEFRLDFPHLMQRAKAIRTRNQGVSWRDWLLARPDLLGRVAGLTPWLVNFSNRLLPFRWALRWVLGIHIQKRLPNFHGQTLQHWFNKNRKHYAVAQPQGKVLLFQTCFGNYNDPSIGQAALEVLHHNDLQVEMDYKTCCGMPLLDAGDMAAAQKQAQANIAHLLPYVQQGYTILALNPTCSKMMRQEYPALVAGEDARTLAAAVQDTSEYLNLCAKEGRLKTDFRSAPPQVTYHVPCHLRMQNMGYPARDLMRKMAPDTQVELVTECSGHDGTWAMKQEFFALSLEAGKKASQKLAQAEPGIAASDCPLAAMHLEQTTGKRVLHPMQILARAYKGEKF